MARLPPSDRRSIRNRRDFARLVRRLVKQADGPVALQRTLAKRSTRPLPRQRLYDWMAGARKDISVAHLLAIHRHLATAPDLARADRVHLLARLQLAIQHPAPFGGAHLPRTESMLTRLERDSRALLVARGALTDLDLTPQERYRRNKEKRSTRHESR